MIQKRIKDEIVNNFFDNCKILNFFNSKNADIVPNTYATAIISMKLELSKFYLDKWKNNKQNKSIISDISDQIKSFSNYVEQFILKGIKPEKSQSIELSDENKSEYLIPNYDIIDTIDIKNWNDFYKLLHQMKNDFERTAQDLVLLCNTTVFEESNLQSIRERLKIREIIPIQNKEIICLINDQILFHPVRFFKDPFEVDFACNGGLFEGLRYIFFIQWRGALKIRDRNAIQGRKVNIRNYSLFNSI